jgi:hypothetical protein
MMVDLIDQYPDRFVFVDTIETSIAGYWYYRDVPLYNNERVSIVREPSNRADPNAFAVRNISGELVGYLWRKLAAKLAPDVDCGAFVLDAYLPVSEYDDDAAPEEDYNLRLNVLVYADLDVYQKLMAETDAQFAGAPAIADTVVTAH